MTTTLHRTTAQHPSTDGPAGYVGPTRTERLDPIRWSSIRSAYTTRFVAAAVDRDPGGFALQSGEDLRPAAGDVVVARVTEIGHHTRLESPVSRRQLMFPGQEIMVAYGNRYAPDQFLAHVPDHLGPTQLVAGGGIAAEVLEQHDRIDQATQIEPIGLLTDEHGVVNLERFAPLSIDTPSVRVVQNVGRPRPPVIAVLGTSMNSGKSTTLACLVNGLTNAGLSVAAGKATGTGAGNDPNVFVDAGARRVIDFTDFGQPTTFRLPYEQVRGLLTGLVAELAADRPDVVVVEVADGLFQGETARLLGDPAFHGSVDSVLFAAQDALGAVGGLQVLRHNDVPVAAVSGLLTSSPLATAEADAAVDVRVIDTYGLCAADTAVSLLPEKRDR
ncbi:hypothetical protein [Microlunatus sp. Y2014]|uniref:hypothetical protein n=1 Tax=Microlunatus sp. Y2014 TaxID=3418488 RepID=UPI003DA71EC7